LHVPRDSSSGPFESRFVLTFQNLVCGD
jgi:hypothetical protein